MTGKIFIVSAPSGAGKTSLINALLNQWVASSPLERVITYTTKAPRSTEIPGKDYHFVSKERFKELIEAGFFLEWSSFYDHYYGTPSYIIEEVRCGKSFILVIDRVGAKQLIQKFADIVTIWIYASSLAELRQRLVMRGTETEMQIERRLHCAHIELQDEQATKLYKYHVLNDNFHDALNSLHTIFSKELAQETTVMKNSFDVENAHPEALSERS
jgi:guanylate kinase